MKGTKLCDRNLERGDGSKVSLLHEDAAVKGNLCPDGTVFVCVDCAKQWGWAGGHDTRFGRVPLERFACCNKDDRRE